MQEEMEFYDFPIQEQEMMQIALDSVKPDPHGNEFELEDKLTEDFRKNYNDREANKRSIIGLQDFPDYSDKEMHDYLLKKLKGIETIQAPIVDLDTAPNYVDFVNLSIKNMQQFENQFNQQSIYDILKEKLKE